MKKKELREQIDLYNQLKGPWRSLMGDTDEMKALNAIYNASPVQEKGDEWDLDDSVVGKLNTEIKKAVHKSTATGEILKRIRTILEMDELKKRVNVLEELLGLRYTTEAQPKPELKTIKDLEAKIDSNISSNASMANYDGRISALENTVNNTHANHLSTHDSQISVLQAQAATHDTRIGDNTANIATNTAGIAHNAAQIAAIHSTLGAQGAQIAQHDAEIVTLQGGLAAINTTVASHASQITALQHQLAADEATIHADHSRLDQHDATLASSGLDHATLMQNKQMLLQFQQDFANFTKGRSLGAYILEAHAKISNGISDPGQL